MIHIKLPILPAHRKIMFKFYYNSHFTVINFNFQNGVPFWAIISQIYAYTKEYWNTYNSKEIIIEKIIDSLKNDYYIITNNYFRFYMNSYKATIKQQFLNYKNISIGIETISYGGPYYYAGLLFHKYDGTIYNELCVKSEYLKQVISIVLHNYMLNTCIPINSEYLICNNRKEKFFYKYIITTKEYLETIIKTYTDIELVSTKNFSSIKEISMDNYDYKSQYYIEEDLKILKIMFDDSPAYSLSKL